jgi:transposase InsO family protein
MIAHKKAFDAGHFPTIHHSDQGGQYAATAYVNLLESKGVMVSMAALCVTNSLPLRFCMV